MYEPNRFPLGQTVVPPGELAALGRAGDTPVALLRGHTSGDWGDLNAEDGTAHRPAFCSLKNIDGYPLSPTRLYRAGILLLVQRSPWPPRFQQFKDDLYPSLLHSAPTPIMAFGGVPLSRVEQIMGGNVTVTKIRFTPWGDIEDLPFPLEKGEPITNGSLNP